SVRFLIVRFAWPGEPRDVGIFQETPASALPSRRGEGWGGPGPGTLGVPEARWRDRRSRLSTVAQQLETETDGTGRRPHHVSLRVEAAEEGRACVQSEQQHEAARQQQQLCGCSVLTDVLSVLLVSS
ncbi:Mediator of replication checkpoint protein 1, partial [Frankliniella fusca]